MPGDSSFDPAVVWFDAHSDFDRRSAAPGAIVIAIDLAGSLPDLKAPFIDLQLTCASNADRKAGWICVQDPVQEVDRLTQAVDRLGPPVSVLAQVLRTASGCAATEALLVESFAYSMLLSGREFKDWRTAHPRRPARQTESADRVRVCRTGDVLALHLANPDQRNAFDAPMRDSLVDALQLAIVDPTIAAIELHGDGPDFCSGGHLDEFGTSEDLSLAHAIRMLQSPVRWLGHIGVPSTAFVHGACVGAGIEIPAAAHRVVADRTARFWLPELAMGLIPGAGGTWSIARRIGRQRLLYWALTGETIDASAALSWGLVDELTDH
ncbi:MAG: enoyl-CoA hydratase/isomerase family protein [Dehalococcoidia bacterium]